MEGEGAGEAGEKVFHGWGGHGGGGNFCETICCGGECILVAQVNVYLLVAAKLSVTHKRFLPINKLISSSPAPIPSLL